MRQIVHTPSDVCPPTSPKPTRSAPRTLVCLGMVALGSLFMGGCTFDSFMDPSTVGRWERTPTRVPILTHIGAIEDPNSQWVEISEITPQDLIPETDIYRVGPGDFLDLTVYDLITRGAAEFLPRQIDQNGYIEIPQLGRIFVDSMTETEVAQAIGIKMAPLVADPLVSVVVQQRRQQIFHLMGNVVAPGPYSILNADFRILEALIAAGGFPEFTEDIYVIRQVPLDDDSLRLSPEKPEDAGILDGLNSSTPTNPFEGESLLDVIDDLAAPGMMSGSRSGNGTGLVPNRNYQPANEPLIDLIESNAPSTTKTSTQRVSNTVSTPRWRFHSGQWIREATPIASRRMIDRGGLSPRDSRGQLFTQRKIRVPVKPLVSGDARYNIIIRPGDTIHVPPSATGFYYIRGEIARPGVFNLPAVGKLTLMRAIAAAGDFGPVAVPERVDLTRMVGHNEQATIMLNSRAIAEGTQPDIYIKPDDLINIGTKFWATPLAILRGGFRTNYGFGFLLDRNFGNDVFGAPPTNFNN